VTFERDSRAPYGSGAGLTQHLCGERRVPGGARRHRPSRRIPGEDPRPRSASTEIVMCEELACLPTPHLAVVRGERAPMRSTDFCFPIFRLRSLAPRRAPASLRGSRLAPSPEDLRRRGRRPGDEAFHDASPASAGFLGFARGVLPPCALDETEPLTPVSPLRRLRLARREGGLLRGGHDRDRAGSVKIHALYDRGCLSPAASPRHARIASPSGERSRDASASWGAPGPFRRRPRTCVREPAARRPSAGLDPNRVKWVSQLLYARHCLPTSATLKRRASNDLERPILARDGAWASRPTASRCPSLPARPSARGVLSLEASRLEAGSEPPDTRGARPSTSASS